MKLLNNAFAGAVTVASLALLAAAPVQAAPTADVVLGSTFLSLDTKTFLPTLKAQHITAAGISPGTYTTFKSGAAEAWFPILGGAVDTTSFHADFDHAGGISLTCGTTTVDLTAFDYDTASSQVTGIVVVKDAANNQAGDLSGRVPLFALTLTAEKGKTGKKVVTIGDVGLSLTSNAVTALNTAFGACASLPTSGSIPVGTATVLVFTK